MNGYFISWKQIEFSISFFSHTFAVSGWQIKNPFFIRKDAEVKWSDIGDKPKIVMRRMSRSWCFLRTQLWLVLRIRERGSCPFLFYLLCLFYRCGGSVIDRERKGGWRIVVALLKIIVHSVVATNVDVHYVCWLIECFCLESCVYWIRSRFVCRLFSDRVVCVLLFWRYITNDVLVRGGKSLNIVFLHKYDHIVVIKNRVFQFVTDEEDGISNPEIEGIRIVYDDFDSLIVCFSLFRYWLRDVL